MKIIIAYDGSRCSEAALDDLVHSGLPEYCDALVISVAEAWLLPPKGNGHITGVSLDRELEGSIQGPHGNDKRIVAEAATLANHAKKRLQSMFPEWAVTAEAPHGSPAREILSRADEFKPNLIVVGSSGHSTISRFFLGSVSLQVLTEAKCSVRVARGRIEVEPGPLRIVVGFDATAGSEAAATEVAKRKWDLASEVTLLTATEPVVPLAIGRFMSPAKVAVADVSRLERRWIEKRASASIEKLRTAGLGADLRVTAGNPKQLIIEEAERWGAECIFVGASASVSRFQRFLIGSTSAAIAARAHCSVEVVRTKDGPGPERRKL